MEQITRLGRAYFGRLLKWPANTLHEMASFAGWPSKRTMPVAVALRLAINTSKEARAGATDAVTA